MAVRKTTLGASIDSLQKQREKVRKLSKELDTLKEALKADEAKVMEMLQEQGMDKATGKLATVSISESQVPSVQDWDAFYKFIGRNKAWYLLQRRTNAAPYRELLETRRGRKIPGVETVTKHTLNLRSL